MIVALSALRLALMRSNHELPRSAKKERFIPNSWERYET